MTKTTTRVLAVLAVIGGMLGLVSCSQESEPVAVSEDTVIVDVRSPEEYAAGHLDGAVLLDLNSGEFASALPNLDPEAEYLVYCRSGNRSGQAVSMMDSAGFTNLTDLGSVEQASQATGIPIVED